jgi:tetratricopeptide (TPR) repeat protein
MTRIVPLRAPPSRNDSLLPPDPVQPATPTPPGTSRKLLRARAIFPLVLIVATLLAYANCFCGVLLFDDLHSLRDPRVQSLWPPVWLAGQRPLVNFTLALNGACGGALAGYHALNLLVHLCAGLLLYGIVRRTVTGTRFANSAEGFALAVALIWSLHPLQTQSVTYIIQRAEALMGLCYLLTLYAALRAGHSHHRLTRITWCALSILSAWLALAAKPVAVTLPVAVILFDRAYWHTSFASALRARWMLYAGLGSSWILLFATGLTRGLTGTTGTAPTTVGFGVRDFGPLEYLYTQAGVILHYLRLAVWPDPLILDYHWPIVRTLGSALLPGAIVLALLGGALWLWRGHRRLAFPACAFFLILAPTSSFVPIVDPVFEHRMYLPLASLSVLAVTGAAWLLQHLARGDRHAPRNVTAPAAAALLLVGLALGWRTALRNRDYQDPVVIWQRNSQDQPTNPRALANWCQALDDAGQDEEALSVCTRATTLAPQYATAWCNQAHVLVDLKRVAEAELAARRAVELDEDLAPAHVTLGYALSLRGDLAGAVRHARAALDREPDNLQALNNLGNALVRTGDLPAAHAAFNRALDVDPEHAETHNNRAYALASAGDLPGAVAAFERAVACDPTLLVARINLAQVYARTGEPARARATYQQALRIAESRGALTESRLIRKQLADLDNR